jgi:polar amino acid transport system substrate-binding protein
MAVENGRADIAANRGYEMLKPIDFYAGIVLFILHHPERYDGHGYSAKLKGERVAIEASGEL